MKIGLLKRVSTGAAVGMIAAAGSANGQSASLVGVEDFRIANVGEGVGGFLPEVTRRNADEGRFQVNGSNPGQNNRVFGLWATFDLDFQNLFSGPIDRLQSVNVDLFQAQPITGQDIDNVITGGTLNLYFTREDADVLDAANGFDWVDTDEEGLGNQFADRVLVGSVELAEGNTDVSFDVDLSSIETSLIDEINSDGFGRFVLTSPDDNFATSWGVGVSGDPDGILEFDGAAPVVTFTVPSPAAASVLGLGGIVLARRRR